MASPGLRLLSLFILLTFLALALAQTPPPSDAELNPDDFHRIDIDLDTALAYHTQYPKPPTAGTNHSRFAYVLIHYEGTPKDDLYVLGTRVVIKSIQETGSKQDIVIICADNVRQSTVDAFLRDGAIVKMVPNIPNPYKGEQQHRRTYKSRFEFTFNKLYVWNLVEYERIIYQDADNLIVRNIDELFLCGHYCTTFFNPLFFHTGMMVVKPERTKFASLLHGLLSLDVFSYDGADQGFLTAAFPGIEKAPLLSPARELVLNEGSPSEEPLMRFPMEYNINTAFYYTKMSFDPFRSANLPISYESHYKASSLFRNTLPTDQLHSPLLGVSPLVQFPNEKTTATTLELSAQNDAVSMPTQLYDALRTKPQDDLDYALPVGSIDYCLAPTLKPWNWFPFIYFHTVRLWAPVRMRLEADDIANGFAPSSQNYFSESLLNGVLPLVLGPLIMTLFANILPVMDQLRKITRTVVRVTGPTPPAAVTSLIALLWSFAHLASTVPLETRPELAWVSVMLIIVLAQYNAAFLLALLCSPPCPPIFGSKHRGASQQKEVDGYTRLKEMGIISTPVYGLTSAQIIEFFKSIFATFEFLSQKKQQQMMLSQTSIALSAIEDNIDNTVCHDDDNDDGLDCDVRENLRQQDERFLLDECDFSYNLFFNEPYSTTALIDNLGGNASTVGYSSLKGKKVQTAQSFNEIDHLNDLDLSMIPSDIDLSDSDLDNSGAIDIESRSFIQNNMNNHHSTRISLDLDHKIASHKTGNIAQNATSEVEEHLEPEKKLIQVHQSLQKSVLSVLESSLSLRGGIYPSLMVIHLLILSLMALWLAKFGSFAHFIEKIVHLTIFLTMFILYSIHFIKKIITLALGDAYSLGKVQL